MRAPNARIAGIVAAGVLSAAAAIAANYEGYRAHAYHDVANVVTACRGHTGADVQAGKVYSPEQCEQWFREDLLKAAKGVQSCIRVMMSVNQFGAYTDLAYNIGIGAFCRSSVARKANAGDREGSCAAISLYAYAGGQRLNGLIRRRAEERKLCETPP